MSAYDNWKLASPPEADEEWIEVVCENENDEGDICTFESKVCAQVSGDLVTWECPLCGSEYEESARDLFCEPEDWKDDK